MTVLSTQMLEQLYRLLMARLSDQSHPEYEYYGGAGVPISKRWSAPTGGFEAFCRDLQRAGSQGRKGPLDHAILFRIDPRKGYFPSNVVVRTDMVEYQGVARTRPEWAREGSMEYHTFVTRLRREWDFADALGIPVIPRKPIVPRATRQKKSERRVPARHRRGKRKDISALLEKLRSMTPAAVLKKTASSRKRKGSKKATARASKKVSPANKVMKTSKPSVGLRVPIEMRKGTTTSKLRAPIIVILIPEAYFDVIQ